MSYTQLYIIELDGNAIGGEEFRNSHGGASMIWTAICRRYSRTIWPDAPLMQDQSCRWLSDDHIWEKFNALPLRWWEYNALRFTYDHQIVKAFDLELMAESLERFEDAHGTPSCVCHLPAMAMEIRETIKDGYPLGVCLYATSCGDNLWSVYDDGSDDCRPYNINIDTKHSFIECKRR
jgi:hypothetical protein